MGLYKIMPQDLTDIQRAQAIRNAEAVKRLLEADALYEATCEALLGHPAWLEVQDALTVANKHDLDCTLPLFVDHLVELMLRSLVKRVNDEIEDLKR